MPRGRSRLASPITDKLWSATWQSADVELEEFGQPTSLHPTTGASRSMARIENAWSRRVRAIKALGPAILEDFFIELWK